MRLVRTTMTLGALSAGVFSLQATLPASLPATVPLVRELVPAPASARSMTPKQITLRAGYLLTGEHFQHGPNPEVLAPRHYTKKRHAVVLTDCAHRVVNGVFSPAPVGMYLIMPGGGRLFGCGTTADGKPKRLLHARFHVSYRLRRYVPMSSCRIMHRTVRHGVPKKRRRWGVPCSRVKWVASNGRETTVRYDCRGKTYAPSRITMTDVATAADGLHLGHVTRHFCNGVHPDTMHGLWLNRRIPQPDPKPRHRHH